MVLGKVEGDSIHVQVAYSMAVNKDLSTWRVSYQGQEIKSSVLSALSSTISSLILSDVKQLLETIGGSKVCAGNAETKYNPLLTCRKETFKHCSGV